MSEGLILLGFLFFSMVIHEYAHAWMALKLGDATAKEMGRLTLNPIKHIDPFGTILLPVILLALQSMGSPFFPVALAKPVPVNFWRLKNPRRSMIWVALAGPGINIALAVALSFLLNISSIPLAVFQLMVLVIYINLMLAIFNMVPIPPLDGSRVLMGVLPRQLANAYARLEPYGILIVFALLPLGLFERLVMPVTSVVAGFLGVKLP